MTSVAVTVASALEVAQIGQMGCPGCKEGTDIHDHEGASAS